MKCRACGNPLFVGRRVLRCCCGAVVHLHCWEKHIMRNHQPQFVSGTVNQDGRFMAEVAEVTLNKSTVDSGLAEVV